MTLQQMCNQIAKQQEQRTGKRFEKYPECRWGRDTHTHTRDAKGKITKAWIVIDQKLRQPKFAALLVPVLTHEIRENLEFQNYAGQRAAHQAAKKEETRIMGPRKKELARLAREAGYYSY